MDVEGEMKTIEKVLNTKGEISKVEPEREAIKEVKKTDIECIYPLQTKEYVGKRRIQKVSFDDEVKFARKSKNTASSFYDK